MCRVPIDGAGAILQFPGEASMQALELKGLGLAQVEVREQTPQGDAAVADPGVLDAAPPAHEARHETARNAIAEQEIDVLLLGQPANQGFCVHLSVISLQ